MVHGSGVEGLFAGKRARFGTAEFALELCGDDAENCSLAINSETRDGEIVAVLAVEGERPALFRFSDTLNSKAPEAAESLRSGRCRRRWWEMADNSKGLELLMLTGDNQTSAKAMAEAIKLAPENVYSGLTPDQKLKLIEDARERKKTSKYPRVAMVGDGINDAPALAAADVGVAIASTPSYAAASAADVLLLTKDDDGGISQLPELFTLADRTRTVLRQNIALAVI